MYNKFKTPFCIIYGIMLAHFYELIFPLCNSKVVS